MKVKILTSIASATWSYAPGEIVDMPEEQAKTWIKSGLAVPVETGLQIEKAIAEPLEKRKRVKQYDVVDKDTADN